jgi:hypothetical protein
MVQLHGEQAVDFVLFPENRNDSIFPTIILEAKRENGKKSTRHREKYPFLIDCFFTFDHTKTAKHE